MCRAFELNYVFGGWQKDKILFALGQLSFGEVLQLIVWNAEQEALALQRIWVPLGPRKTTYNFGSVGRSQDLPDANWLLSSQHSGLQIMSRDTEVNTFTNVCMKRHNVEKYNDMHPVWRTNCERWCVPSCGTTYVDAAVHLLPKHAWTNVARNNPTCPCLCIWMLRSLTPLYTNANASSPWGCWPPT